MVGNKIVLTEQRRDLSRGKSIVRVMTALANRWGTETFNAKHEPMGLFWLQS